MSKKTLLGLAVVLAVLVAALWWSGRPSTAPAGEEESAAGALLSSVDMNTVGAITIADGTATTHLAKVEGAWRVDGLDGYPADFDRLQRMMRAIDDTQNPQVADEGADRLAEFGLAADSDPAPLRLILEHGGGMTVLYLGRLREPQADARRMWGPPPGRYVRVGEGPVLLIKEDLGLIQADADQWWDRRLLELEPEAIRKMEVARADGSYAIERAEDGTFALADGAGEGEVDAAAANRLFGALRNLRADRMLGAGEEDEGVFAEALVCRAETEAAAYRIEIGAAPPDHAGSRPVKIKVTPTSEAASEQQALAALAAGKLNGRTFLIPAFQADAMTLQREVVVSKPESAPEAAEPSPAEEAEPAGEEASPEAESHAEETAPADSTDEVEDSAESPEPPADPPPIPAH